MKITVGIPSRGRPLDLTAAVLSLDKTKSGGCEVDYIIAADRDDNPTRETISRLRERGLPMGPALIGADRPLGLGQLHNAMASACDPDATFLLWSDRCVPITEGWDHAIAVAAMQYPQRVLWLDSVHLLGAGQFILPPAWRAALPTGKACPGYFPFWFEDSHVEEVDAFVHGFPRMATYAKCAGPRTQKTNRMRDLEFWIRFYAFLRPARLKEAEQIAANLGVPPRDNADLLAHWQRRDADFIARAPELTERFGTLEPPDDAYRTAKANAEKMMWDGGVDPHTTILVDALAEAAAKTSIAEAVSL
jgi:hypothetical protein